jgi:hypothetical protein
MFIGHYGVAFALKGARPSVSLGTLFVAVTLADILLWLFVLAGLEQVRIREGFTASVPLEMVSIPLSHGLLANVGLSLVVFAVFLLRDRAGGAGAKTAGVVALAVLSHFMLDLMVHAPDMPLLGSGGPRVGLGLYDHPAITHLLEVGLCVAGFVVYLRALTPTTLAGRVLPIALAGLLVLLQFFVRGSAKVPTDLVGLGVKNLVGLLAIAGLAYFVGDLGEKGRARHRPFNGTADV